MTEKGDRDKSKGENAKSPEEKRFEAIKTVANFVHARKTIENIASPERVETEFSDLKERAAESLDEIPPEEHEQVIADAIKLAEDASANLGGEEEKENG
jgi:hypothetical protein